MNDPTLIPILVGLAVIVLTGGAGLVFSKSLGSVAEQRLDGLNRGPKARVDTSSGTLLRMPAIELGQGSFWSRLIPDVESLNRLYEQADISLSFNRFMWVVGGLAVLGGAPPVVFGPHPLLAPVGAAAMGGLPFAWLVHRKKQRVRKFLDAMPEAVELISRALRAGHGLASGLRLVAEEMKGPIADEFGRVFEEQNLGIPIEVALRGLGDRIPAMDVRFFVIAVVIQRADRRRPGRGARQDRPADPPAIRAVRTRQGADGRGPALRGRASGPAARPARVPTVSNYNYVGPAVHDPAGQQDADHHRRAPARRGGHDQEDRCDQGVI